jgi:galactofuranosylgalactofuranosylrhamnosyl-N-acetylglucosaminyl-diphospho-decaprenol beta-1,5/1,6-galactofuranosyltransferase
MSIEKKIILQKLMLPNPEICEIKDMFYRSSARYDSSKVTIFADSPLHIDLHSYFNIIPARHYCEYLKVNNLNIQCSFSGRAEFLIYVNNPGYSDPSLLVSGIFNNDDFSELELFQNLDITNIKGYCYITINTHSPFFELRTFDVYSYSEKKSVSLGVVICTFKRENLVKRTCAVIIDAINKNNDEFTNTDIYVIDNDQCKSLSLPDHKKLHQIANQNLGGAGGFTRGIIQCMDSDKSYVLLCDDDITLQAEVLRRSVVALTLLQGSNMGLHGAMLEHEYKSSLHEIGEYFDKKKRLHINMNLGLSMSEINHVKHVTFESIGNTKSANMFGWWFTAFPISLVKKIGLPLPLFVSGDDLEYSLRAVDYGYKAFISPTISVWHPSHMSQHAPIRTYFIMRNRLAFLSVHSEKRNVVRMYKIIVQEALHMALTKRYATCDAICAALEDFLRGNGWYNEDLSDWRVRLRWPKRENVVSFYVDEWCIPINPVFELKNESTYNKIIRNITFGGHLLSFLFHSKSDHPSSIYHKCVPDGVSPISKKINRISFRASSIFYYDQRAQVGFRVEHNNWMFWRSYYRLFILRIGYRFKINHAFQSYKKSFFSCTTADWWRKRLGI